ncbi:MAG: ABC transporter ATP-binding protein [Eubacteriales bacterium]|nr:ABC transporter ATP-binding protein/permease [Clostridiales bacterium]MDD7308303.1 ABC transporter ATP-binding protein [Eubacteriales bacterium]
MKETMKYFKPYIPYILAAVVLLFAEAMLELALPGYMADIIDDGIIAGDMKQIYKIGILMIGISAAIVLCATGVSLFASKTAARSARDIRKAVFRKVMHFANEEMEDFSTASLITRSTNDIQQIQMAAVMTLRLGMFAPVMGIGAIIKALRTSVSLAWTIGIAFGAIVILMAFMFIITLPKFKVVQEKVDKLNLVMNERLRGILVIRAFNTQKYEEDRFDHANNDLTKLNLFVNRAMSVMMPVMMLIMNLTSILIVWAGAHYIDAGNLEIGSMLAFIQYAMQIIISFLFIAMMFIFLPRAAVSMGRVGEILKKEISITDKENTQEIRDKCGVVEFKNVSFRYADAEDAVLSDISFTARPGETTAFIGSTGSGKTTLVNLIPRFFDVTEGSITIDGVDIRDMKQHDLREMIGYVPQKGMLFSGDIKSNIAYGAEDKSFENIKRAAEVAQAEDFIMEKEEGFDAPVAQGGTNVSGGQKQRLSIARALAKKAPIYIFDDSFSALDFKTDAALRKELKKSAGESTLLIVAQRISTIADADQIIVLNEGRIAGKGTHKELMQTCGVYREIASSQLDSGKGEM